ncbi:MAG: DUF2279 domain-containing protein [Cytophagales bacterium]|nr:DUF2279 domain-containing protein [Cytophagales bacterium]
MNVGKNGFANRFFFIYKRWIAKAACPHTHRIIILLCGSHLIYVLIFAILFQVWYGQDNITTFHWFDDRAEWLLMDKFGHFYVSYLSCSIFYSLWLWAGLNKNTSLIFAAFMAIEYQCGYEIADGFYAGYGASAYDICANIAGALAYVIQILLFNKILAGIKFSFYPSSFHAMRPELLGHNLLQQLIKDYNGQTYWFAIHNPFITNKILPSWLMPCIGIGAEGLLGGHDNVGAGQGFAHIARCRKIIFSFDICVDAITNKTIKNALWIFRYIKVPMPAVVINFCTGIKLHYIYL